MKFEFVYKKRKFSLDVDKCESILSQARGLMFRKKSKPLLFIFKDKKKRAIHSFFCRPFVAIWFDGDKIIGIKTIKKSKFYIVPDGKFDKLLEISENNPQYSLFADEEKI
ncbi:MAG: hypothetical protein WCX73_01975 [Candidatus Pacearchaeota archaeon]|jgi:uncharacterized membrane protein (UPF0127 family)